MKNTKLSMMEILKSEGAKFDDVSVLEAVKEAVILTLNDALKDIEDSAHNFATTMTMVELGAMDMTDEIRASLIATMIKGALSGAFANEIGNQLKELDEILEFNKGTSEASTDEEEMKVEGSGEFELDAEELINVLMALAGKGTDEEEA